MNKKIDTRKKVYFYDDRGKEKAYLTLKKVLYENDNVCLCTVEGVGKDWADDQDWVSGLGEILFDLNTGNVKNEEPFAWFATNKKPE